MSIMTTPRAVPALDLKAQYRSIKDEIEPIVLELMENQLFVMGAQVSGLEQEIADYCDARWAVGCASGSDALLLPLMAWDIGPGDEVITTPYTFFASAGSIWRLGARPVFVDIEPRAYNMDPERLEAAITPKTKAIMPIHLYGQTAEMAPIQEIAKRRNLPILEDAAQAIGAKCQDQRAGTMGTAAALSFYPSKNLGGFGDGGMIVTNDEDLAKRMARLRVHGMEPRYHHHEVGFNSRLDALQAAVLRIKLRHLDDWTEARRLAAKRYHRLFDEHRLVGSVVLPYTQPDHYHVFNQYVIRVAARHRDELRAFLADRQIGTEIYYPIPLHLQKCFQSMGHKMGDFPESEAAARQTIALPIYPELPEESQAYVVESIRDYFRESSVSYRDSLAMNGHGHSNGNGDGNGHSHVVNGHGNGNGHSKH